MPEVTEPLAKLADIMSDLEYLQKAVAKQNEAVLLQQPGGMFTKIGGIERPLFSTAVHPTGIGSYLPAMPNTTDDPRYGFWMGYGAQDAGSEPDYICDDALTNGPPTTGNLTASYGLIQRGTHTIEISQLAKKARVNSSDLYIAGTVYNPESPMTPPSSARNVSAILNSTVASEMVGVGVNFERKFAKLIWRGNPANNTANGGYKEFRGLDLLIKTGYVDADGGGALPALDSLIVNFADDFDTADPTKDIVRVLSSVMWYMDDLAERTGLAPVTYAVVMPRELFWLLTSIWACRYMTDRCASGGSGLDAPQIVLNDSFVINYRDAMRNGRYLTMNGKQYPVIVDDGIVVEQAAGGIPNTSSSSIYILPLRVMSGFPALHWEYIDYNALAPEMAALGVAGQKLPFWTEGGKFIWSFDGVYTCFKLKAQVEPRVILRTPHLAARIQDIRYKPDYYLRSPFPGDPNYVGGGVSTRV